MHHVHLNYHTLVDLPDLDRPSNVFVHTQNKCSILYTGLDGPLRLPEFVEPWHMKVARFQPYAPATVIPGRYPFLLGGEMTLGPECRWKD